MQETGLRSLGWEGPREILAPHSRIPAWRIPQTRGRRESDVTEPRSPSLTVLPVDLVCDQLWLQGRVAGGPPWAPQKDPRLSALLSLSSESLQLLSRGSCILILHQPCKLRSQSCRGLQNFLWRKIVFFSDAEYQASAKQILRNERPQSSLFTLKYIHILVGIFL